MIDLQIPNPGEFLLYETEDGRIRVECRFAEETLWLAQAMWLDFAEDQALRRKEVFLKDWAKKLDAFLKFNERDVLDGAGQVSKKRADAHAEGQYEQFAAQRRAILEAEGAKFNVRALEAAAKTLSKINKTRK